MPVDNSEQIAALRAAIAEGVRRVVFHDGGTRREVEYHSIKDMKAVLDMLLAEQSPRPSVTFVGFRTGRWTR